MSRSFTDVVDGERGDVERVSKLLKGLFLDGCDGQKNKSTRVLMLQCVSMEADKYVGRCFPEKVHRTASIMALVRRCSK